MARSKRTDRAEARRRYRAYLAHLEQVEAEGGDSGAEDEPAARSASRSAESGPARRPGQRLGFFAALKGAVRPVHYVDDVKYLPKLITGTPAIWLPTLIAVASAAFALTRVNNGTVEAARSDLVIQITVGFILSPFMPLLPALIAGFFAPRASWLAGILVSFVTTVAFGVVLAARPEIIYEGEANMRVADVVSRTAMLMTYSLPFGALLAAFSAWYKRFLELSGPAAALAAQRRAEQKQAGRQGSSRRR